MAQASQSEPLPNEDPATVGAYGSYERRGLRDSHSIQSRRQSFQKLKQAANLQTFLGTVVSEKF